MPIYDFTQNPPRSVNPTNAAFQGSQEKIIDHRPIQVPSLEKKDISIVDEAINYAPEEVREVASRGFFALDDGLKNWMSGIKIPTLDSYKIANVHVVTQDRSILSWAQEFIDGRVSLPVISIQRTSWTFDPTRFTPPYVPIRKEYTDNTMRRVRQIYRPIPFKVDYSIFMWCEFKKDAEYIDNHIITRSNPLGIFYVEDEYYSQQARVKHTGSSDNSDIDIVKERAKVIYNANLQVEYAIPINEKIVPTVLGRVATVKESPVGEIFDVYRVDDF
jgi:hypothetical protein